MTTNLCPYPSYKAVGLPWLDKVPSHWQILRIKDHLREFDNRSRSGEGRLLSLRLRQGLIDHLAAGGKPIPADALVGYKHVEPGTMVMNRMRAASGLFGVATSEGLVSPDYATFRPASNANTKYLLNLFKSPLLTQVFRADSKGLGTGEAGFLRLYTDRFGAIHIPDPSAAEKAAIVRFLDLVDRRIRHYIRAKQKLAKLLIEERLAIAQHYVTRGYDSTVRFKRSDFDWLGEIPAHWEVSRVKNEFKCLDQKRIPLSSTERGSMSLRLYDYYGASGIIDKVESYLFDDELLLLAEDGANLVLRNLPLAIIAIGKFWVNNHAHILKPLHGNIRYLAALMETLDYRPWISGAAQPKLTQDRLMSIAIAVPPQAEQDIIVTKIQSETVSLADAIGRTQSEISLLREYRTRLITDVVTGQLDVREAAASLRDETDELDGMSDEIIEETDEEANLDADELVEDVAE